MPLSSTALFTLPVPVSEDCLTGQLRVFSGSLRGKRLQSVGLLLTATQIILNNIYRTLFNNGDNETALYLSFHKSTVSVFWLTEQNSANFVTVEVNTCLSACRMSPRSASPYTPSEKNQVLHHVSAADLRPQLHIIEPSCQQRRMRRTDKPVLMML